MYEKKSSKTITVFGSSSPREGSEAYEIAYRLGARLAALGFALCNGGYAGTMEAAAKGAHEAGAKTTGVILPSFGPDVANTWIDETIKCDELSQRIATLVQRGDGYVILPGGTGTLAEIGMLLELMNKQAVEPRPVVFLGRFWQPLLQMLSQEKVLRRDCNLKAAEEVEIIGLLAITDSPDAAAKFLAANLL